MTPYKQIVLCILVDFYSAEGYRKLLYLLVRSFVEMVTVVIRLEVVQEIFCWVILAVILIQVIL